ncbi:transcription factor [Striga asiatica]|uniref:Transcription factor n=1 Tax=Striga asiatica TaxID=4170 RepID=A0A5A7QHI1_STRAF|nr:transcription factor [Striga asiatica]
MMRVLKEPPSGFRDFVQGYFRKMAHTILLNFREKEYYDSLVMIDLFVKMFKVFEENGAYCKHHLWFLRLIDENNCCGVDVKATIRELEEELLTASFYNMATGNFPQPRLSSQKLATASESCDFSNPLWRKRSLELRSARICSGNVETMGRRARLDRRRVRPRNPIDRKVRILKRLVTNCESSINGVEGLFEETANYVMALEMRVKVMKIMVNVLKGDGDE